MIVRTTASADQRARTSPGTSPSQGPERFGRLGGVGVRRVVRDQAAWPAIVLALVVANALAVLPAAARVTSAATTHHKLFVAVSQNMPAVAEKKLVVAVDVNQNGGPWASSEATPRKPAVFIQENSRRYLVKVFLETSCKGVCETMGYRISGAVRHKLMVIPSCQYANEVFTCSKIRVVKVY
jgi:hypothetical protein